MSDASKEFNHLLNIGQIETLLQSVVEIAPYVLFMVDLEDNVLAQAIPAGTTDEVVSQIYEAVKVDSMASEIQGKPYTETRLPIDIRGHLVGYIVGISLDPDAQVTQNVAITTRLISQVLADQTDKEYELNSLSVELLSRYEEITLLYELGEALGAIFDVPAICNIALEMALQVISAKKAYISLMEKNQEYMTVVTARGINGFEGWRIPTGEGISGYVAATGRQVLLDAREPLSLAATQPLQAGAIEKPVPPEAILSIPLILISDRAQDRQSILGVVTMAGKPPGKMFTAGDAKLLTTIATQVTTAIHNSQLVAALREAERVQQQIEIAAQIQQSLLPKQAPQLSGIELFGQCIPAANVGGDYYDFFTDESGSLTLLIADVSGHSIGTALMMATARSTLRHELVRGVPLAAVVADTNNSMLDDLFQAEMFISLFCSRYDLVTRKLTFVNGGHNPPLLWRAVDEQIIELDTDGMILGVLDNVTYEEKSTVLERGDILVLYTDGVVEARNPEGKQFSQKRLQKLVKKHNLLSPAALTEQIYEAVGHYTENMFPRDDITLLILKVL